MENHGTNKDNEPGIPNVPSTEETIKKIFAGLSSEEIQKVIEIVRYFAQTSDKELRQVFRRLPVHDVEAIQTKYIDGRYFIEFGQKMKPVWTTELEVMHLARNILRVLVQEELTHKDINSIKFALKRILTITGELKQNRQRIRYDDVELRPNYSEEISDEVVASRFPDIIKALEAPTDQKLRAMARAIAERIYEKSRTRTSASRRREFRKAIIRNHQYLLKKFLPSLDEKYPLHETRLDRVVIDVIHPALMTFDRNVKRKLKSKVPDMAKALTRNRIPTCELIECLNEIAEEEQDETIDQIVELYEQQRKSQLTEGVVHNGLLVMEGDFYKAILTLEPKKKGAPIRLRLIVNVQSIIQQELFEKFPTKRDNYRKQTWLEGSEVNFLTPGDYEYYYLREKSICNIIEMTARTLFIDTVQEHLNIPYLNSQDLILHASQWEVCWEEEFDDRYTDDLEYGKYPCPGLVKHIDGLRHRYCPYARAYATSKYEKETERPSFNCDLPSMDPTTPMMQFKVYPKYRYALGNKIMLRHEMIAGKFFKEFGKDSPDSLPISMKVLSNPAYCRETVERLLQLELYLNGMEGLGYNKRFENPTLNEKEEWLLTLISEAIFGRKAEKYSPEFQAWRDTGKVPGSLPANYKKKFRRLRIDRKYLRTVGEDDEQ